MQSDTVKYTIFRYKKFSASGVQVAQGPRLVLFWDPQYLGNY